jgi:hypothetical protein
MFGEDAIDRSLSFIYGNHQCCQLAQIHLQSPGENNMSITLEQKMQLK